jgi:adenylate cyclase
LTVVPLLDIHLALQKATSGDLDGATQQARAALDYMFDYAAVWSALGTAVFVETLLDRCGDGDREDGRAAIDTLVALPTDPELVLNEITLLRLTVLLARVHGDETAYRDYRDRYRAMAKSLGFEGHMQWCEEKS